MADQTLLSWINAEVDRALTLVQDSIAKFSAAPENEAVLQPCPEHLHQVSGALRMVGLNGATLVCEAIEGSFAGINGQRPSAQAMGVIDRAVVALKNFVGELARGQADVPLRLYPVYRDLSGLIGKKTISEKDLFFPDFAVTAPVHANAKAVPEEQLTAFLQGQRTRFQRGLLAWLRGTPAGLEEMRQTVDAMHQIATQLPEPRGLWWAAGALLDSLEKGMPGEAEWLSTAKVVCNRIDFQIRDLAAGGAKNGDLLMRDLLFAVARREPVTPRIKEVKQLYQLESLFPRPERTPDVTIELEAERLEAALFDLHSRLDALKHAWEQYVAGEPDKARVFRERVADFKAKIKDLGSTHLVKLIEAISLVAGKLPEPYPRQGNMMVIEMASAFLLVENIVDHFSSPADDMDAQIVIMGGWLLDAAKGKSNGEPPAGLRPDLTERIGALQVRAQVAREVLANLQHIEQVVDTFSREGAAGKRSSLSELQPYLRQAHGALSVLGFPKAAKIISICETLVLAQARGEHTAGDDVDWIAEGLSSVAFFLEPCRHGREPSEEAVRVFFGRYEKRAQVPAPDASKLEITFADGAPEAAAIAAAAAAQSAPAKAAPAPAAANVDPELLQVFLEEAVEVLDTINKTVPESKHKPDDREALTTIRRAFHTLKGSGRMVGLTEIGEVAWEVEQVMNLWLEQKRSGTPVLYTLLETATASFSEWIAALRGPGLKSVDGTKVTALAKAAKSGGEPDSVTVGTVTVSRGLYDIYTKEASEHIAVLEAQCKIWRAAPQPADASPDFMRAAHTLGSTSRTAGFAPLADLAAALEHWTGFAAETDPKDADVIQKAVSSLHGMVDSVRKGEAPASPQAEHSALRALIARLEAARRAAVKPPPPQAPDGREKRVMRDDIDPQLLPIFVEEAEQIVPNIGSDLRDWKANPTDEKIHQSLRRLLHTLKGSARMAGAIRLGELCHLMEGRVEAALESGQYTEELFEWLQDRMDRLSTDVERMRSHETTVVVGAPAAPAPAETKPATSVETPAEAAPVAAPAPAPAPRVEAPLPSPGAMLRVNADTLDDLINEAGEVAIARSRIEAELRAIKQALGDLSESVGRIRGQLREVEVQADSQMQSRVAAMDERKGEFDPLEFDRYTRLQELTRLMAESLSDVMAIQQGLQKNMGDTDAALQQQARINRDVQQELMRVRAVPFSNLNERLYRITRQTSRELGKKAELEISGSEVDLDRSVLDRISAPLEHMLRNALVHGIEDPAARVAAGKAESGRISITLRQESNEIALVFADDGAGLNLDALRKKGAQMGLLPTDREPTEGEIAHLIFASGLSTADKLTELAGRGVGMDVVKNEITAIGGRVDIVTQRGGGTTFTVYLPLTLAVTQAVLVHSGGATIALASAMVEQVLRLKGEVLSGHFESRKIEFQDRTYPLYSLQSLLGMPGNPQIQPYNSVLLLRSGIQRVAVHVDELLGNHEIVVKSIGHQLTRVPGVSGATVLADGTVALIMNPVHLAHRSIVGHATTTGLHHTTTPAAVKAAPPVVMVVDDSLTVRKITGRLLEREGYTVVTAKDGVDALEQMAHLVPKVMLLDIEMPRMDGFDLARNVRGDARLQAIPIIMISSRTAEKHRSQAAELGVNHFLGKPYGEAELLQLIAQYSQ